MNIISHISEITNPKSYIRQCAKIMREKEKIKKDMPWLTYQQVNDIYRFNRDHAEADS